MASSRLTRTVVAATARMTWVAACMVARAACTSWLDADDDSGGQSGPADPGEGVLTPLPTGVPVILPSAPPEVGGDGPYVPATPGLRVPNAGYWTRARLDANDVLLPYTWVSLQPAEGQIVVRLEAVVTSAAREPSLEAVIPIALPGGGDVATLVGLELGPSALARAVIGLRTSESDLWLVAPTRLRFDTVRADLVTGTLEGDARRGLRGQRVRHFEAAFVALRAPSSGSVPPGR
jgi:hypothetical protein